MAVHFIIKVAAICALLNSVSGGVIRPFLREDFNITGNQTREYSNPYFPYGLPAVPRGPKNISLHHIVPAETMKDFYNVVLEKSIPEEVNKLGEGLNNVLKSLDSNWKRQFSDNGNDYEKKAAENVNISRNATIAFCNMLQNYSNTMNFDAFPLHKQNEIKEGFKETIKYYIWLPGNLYVGPTTANSSDVFDTKACQLVDKEHCNHLQKVNELMDKFVVNRTGARNEQLVNDVAKELEKIAVHDPFIFPYDKSKWIHSTDSKDSHLFLYIFGGIGCVLIILSLSGWFVITHRQDR